MNRRSGLLLAALAAPALAPSTAHAYCALYTCKDVTEADAAQSMDLEPHECERTDGCISEGHQLYWDSNCLTFGVSGLNSDGLNLSPEDFEDIVADSFKVWEGVECSNGKHPGFKIQTVGVVDSNGDFFCEDEPTANLSVWSLVTRWDRSGSALGYTSSTHNRRNGEVFDADVELNLNKIVNETAPQDYQVVLGKIVVHEAGHFLGLAHSQDEEAVMYAQYDTFDLFTRELNQDDIDGICALYPPDDGLECSKPGYVEAALNEEACEQAALAADDAQQSEGSCSVVAVRSSSRGFGWAAAGAVFGLAALRRRKRAGASRLPV